MDTWFSYRLSDFVLFSERVYWRLFEQVNDQTGVLLAVIIALGCVLLAGTWSRHRAGRMATAILLAAFWVSSAVLFVWLYYTPVNWAARYAVPLLLLEAGLIVAVSLTRQLTRPLQKSDPRVWVGMTLLGYAVVIHPITSLVFGRTIDSAEIIGLSPDATAIATLGWVLMMASRLALWLLLPVPMAVCVLSGLTLYSLRTPEAWVLVVALAMTCVALITPRLNLRSSDAGVLTNTRHWK